MRITGAGILGEPADRGAALATLRKARELGITLIDTADSEPLADPNDDESLDITVDPSENEKVAA